MSGYTGRNRTAAKGGPNGVQRLYASQLKESEALFHQYEHLNGLPRTDAALTMLRKVGSLVKPIMRKRNWTVKVLAEFLPPEQNLLGLNINRGYKICIRLRYHNNPDLFLPLEQVVDTMLHELSHNVWGDHDSNFHRLWDELRDEHETLVRKGYTGEGFLSEGQRLGGGGRHGIPPPHEMRRLARSSAEKRKAQGTLSKGSGQRLGGTPLHLHGGDMRSIIAEQATMRNTINKGCASGRQDAVKLSDQAASNTFRTKGEEDDANDRAIAQALFELMEEEEERKLQGTLFKAPVDGGLAWSPDAGLYDPSKADRPPTSDGHDGHPSEEEQLKWALQDSTSGSVSSLPNAEEGRSIAPEELREPHRSDSAPPVPVRSKPRATSTRTQSSDASPEPDVVVIDDASAAQRQKADAHPSALMPGPWTKHPKPQTSAEPTVIDLTDPHNPDQWTCEICTCINPLRFLICDACGTERSQPGPVSAATVQRSASTTQVPRWTVPKAAQRENLGWNCGRCGAFMEHKWWTCSSCGLMKESS